MGKTKSLTLAAAILSFGIASAFGGFGGYLTQSRTKSTSSDPLRFNAAIQKNKLHVTFKNVSPQSVRIESHVEAQERHCDNIHLLVIDPDMKTHSFSFVDDRDRSFPVDVSIGPGKSHHLDIDLPKWNEKTNRWSKSFHFRDGVEYIVVCSHEWTETKQRTIRVNYVADAIKVMIRNGRLVTS